MVAKAGNGEGVGFDSFNPMLFRHGERAELFVKTLHPVGSSRNAEHGILADIGEFRRRGTSSNKNMGEGVVALHFADGLARFLGSGGGYAAGMDNDDVGIIVQGGLYNTLIRTMERLGVADAFGNSQVPLYVLNVAYPLVDDEIVGFCEGKRAVLAMLPGRRAAGALDSGQQVG